LEPIGENFLVQTLASGEPVVSAPQAEGAGQLVQGMLETSNVNVVQELVDMIETQRAYEINSKSISAADEMLRFMSNKM
jgi:flagellar basal-body rod protein FlgG